MSTRTISKMAAHTIATLPRIPREGLADLLRTHPSSVAVIDVRDSDYIGGHIRGCAHVPGQMHDVRMPELVRTLRGRETVVFHCALSQQRGPSAALKYLRERERMLGPDYKADGVAEQRVMVLDGGFVRWQEKYGDDEQLTEGYDKELWAEGY